MQLLWRRGFDGGDATPVLTLGNAGIPHEAAGRLAAAGFRVVDVELPAGFDALFPAARLIQDYEGARTHRSRWEQHGERIGRKMAELVCRGLATAEKQYRAALVLIQEQRRAMGSVFAAFPVVLTRAASGIAPVGLESTGDPRMQAPWTALGTPAISVPLLEENGMPLGIQMTAAPGNDDPLLATAVQAEEELA
jgi:Asp-tRNA(Asn)/Glu-tRNA(Gln) amidotransferase A subunit family amidase